MMRIDLHLDLAMNALEWNRDLRQELHVINTEEIGKEDKKGRGQATVSFPALREGNISIVVATILAKCKMPNTQIGWHSPQQAWAHIQAQLAWYKEMEACGEIIQLTTAEDIIDHLGRWQLGDTKAIGYILSLEGADALVDIDYLDKLYAAGLRALGPAHYGPGRYANGTNATGKMGEEGIALVKRMEALNMILDLSHLCDDAFWQALELYNGPVWASHNLCRSIVPHNRQFSDEQIKAIIERKGLIGIGFDAWMIVPNWEKGKDVSIEHLIDHIAHICSLAGNTDHVVIGSDLDGGYGKDQAPVELTSIADLGHLPERLTQRGFSTTDIEKIMYGNALNFLKTHL